MDNLSYLTARECLSDQSWRLSHLYRIKDAQGRDVVFKPNAAQAAFLGEMHELNVILKARQLGFSTFILIYLLDCCLFKSHTSAGVIAQGLVEAEDLFTNKVKFAYERLPNWLRTRRRAVSDNARELVFSNGSSIKVGTSLRGGTFQLLHVSEYGKIAARYPEKAIEIKTGALNTVHVGQKIFIESTAEGQSGEFFDLVQRAERLKAAGGTLSPLDPKLHFYGWNWNDGYRLSQDVSITQEMEDYFAELPFELEPEQKAWYVKKAEQQGEYMKREYPSLPKEAFEKTLEGAIYVEQMAKVRASGQIGHYPHDASRRVTTFWDLGRGSDMTVIWFFQNIDGRWTMIDYHESSNEGWAYYASLLANKGYVYQEHVLPWDGANRQSGKEITTARQDLQELGIKPIRIVSKTKNMWSDIKGKCRSTLTRIHFDEKKCIAGIRHLDNYRREWDDKLSVWKDRPRHDDASHGADAFRTFAMGYREDESEYYGQPRYEQGVIGYDAVGYEQEEYDPLDW
jgi:hypothetical protein